MTRREFIARIATDVDLVRKAIALIHRRHLARPGSSSASGWSSSDTARGEALYAKTSTACMLDGPTLIEAKRFAKRYAKQIVREMRCGPDAAGAPHPVHESRGTEESAVEASHAEAEDGPQGNGDPTTRSQRQAILATLGRTEPRRPRARAT